MFSISKPQGNVISLFLASQAKSAFSYSEVGATRDATISEQYRGFTVDHNRIRLGSGIEVFHRAAAAVRDWKMFQLGWVDLFPVNAPILTGQTVAVRVHHFGFWSLNACRIVYTINETRTSGFAYGTLQEHAERGEERFSVEWRSDDSVWFDILAFSKPRLPARLGKPLARRLQKRFARDAMIAIQACVESAAAG